MMFRSLYARLMVLFLAVLLVAMAFLSAMLYQRISSDKVEARLSELVLQARDIALLAGERSVLDLGLSRYLVRKTQEIMHAYDAFIVVVDRYGNTLPIGSDEVELSYEITVEMAESMVQRVYSGEEVRVRSTVKETGNPVFTVGVPYVQDGQVRGAVFIHTSEQNVEASYRDILEQVLGALLIAVAIGSLLVLVVSRLITRPLRDMALAAERFARGDFERRVVAPSKDEVGRLAESFNSMAGDLDRLEQTRREFVANVSHELRSPLTSMQGFISAILDGTVPEAGREQSLRIVLEETKRLARLINELLDLSRIEGGQAKLSLSEYDINEQIARVLARQEGRISERSLEVELGFAAETCPVRADPDRIEQVLINLIDNAIQYVQPGGRITIATRREKGLVRVSVSDNGPGIAEEDLPCLFERFYKADKAHTAGKGTGLGLAIAKKILAQHGQTIAAHSKLGEGAKFEFTLEGASY